MSLLEMDPWSDSLFSGEWTECSGEMVGVIEPATGDELGRIALANADDVWTAARAATAAQPHWAKTPYQERAAILRRAGDRPPRRSCGPLRSIR